MKVKIYLLSYCRRSLGGHVLMTERFMML